MDLKQWGFVFKRKRKFWHKDRPAERNSDVKAQGREDHLQGKEHPRLPANPQKAGGKNGVDPPSQPSEGTSSADTLISDF